MQNVIEESVESFMTRYRPYAVEVELLSHLEGSPLLECLVQQKVLHVLERTGPYYGQLGKVKVIINPMTELISASDAVKQLEVSDLSKLRAQGLVLERDERSLVIDAGVALVVSSLGKQLAAMPGDWVSFESLAPVHGFILSPEKRVSHRRAEESDGI
jgi:hypothetical protein